MCGVCAEYTKIQISMSILKTLSKQSYDNVFSVNSIPCNSILLHLQYSENISKIFRWNLAILQEYS